MGFIVQIRPEVLKRIREEFPVGCKVELVRMEDRYREMPQVWTVLLLLWMTRVQYMLRGPMAAV